MRGREREGRKERDKRERKETLLECVKDIKVVIEIERGGRRDREKYKEIERKSRKGFYSSINHELPFLTTLVVDFM